MMNLKRLYYKEYFKDVSRSNRRLTSVLDLPTEVLSEQNELLKNSLKDRYQELDLEVKSPGLLIGTGYAHEQGIEGEFKLGLFFDHTSGLPVISGSSVKGMLNAIFPEEKEPQETTQGKTEFLAEFFDLKGDENERLKEISRIKKAIFEGLNDDGTSLPMIHRPAFFDAFPVSLKGKLFENDVITPHKDNPLADPVPLPLLKIAQGVKFRFSLLLSPALFKDGGFQYESGGKMVDFAPLTITIEKLLGLLEFALITSGIGAKTNVGYGRFKAPTKPKVWEVGEIVEGVVASINFSTNQVVYNINGVEYGEQVGSKDIDKFKIIRGVRIKLRIKAVDEQVRIKYVTSRIPENQ